MSKLIYKYLGSVAGLTFIKKSEYTSKLSNKSVLINWVAILHGLVFRQRISTLGKGEKWTHMGEKAF